MNKKVLILSTLGLLTSLVMVHGATISAPTMRMGAKGKDVVILQEFLVSKGYLILPQGVAKGTFGAMTRDAVKKFQKENNIEQTGNFGVKTKALYVSLSGGALPVVVEKPKIPSENTSKDQSSCLTKTDGSVSCATIEDEDSCKAKGGVYNECGSLCDSSKEGVACPAVCVKTCTIMGVKTSPSQTASTSSPVLETQTSESKAGSSPSPYTPISISTNKESMCDDRQEGETCKYLSEKGVTDGVCVAVRESLVCQ